jgi:Fe2+ or Zn2+ uptake regulation protein
MITVFQRKNMNYSRQRDLIMEYLKTTSCHPTAEKIYEKVKLQEPNISLGTVYRNLKQLVDNKMILRLHMGDGVDRFDANISEHNHLYCTNCGKVYDLEKKIPDKVVQNIYTSDFQGENKIYGFVIYFYGKCRSCKLLN